MTASATWRDELLREREHKDEYFRNHPHSPIPADQRDDFAGLSYYDPDPEFRVEADLAEHESKQTITVTTSTDGEREYVEWGEFRFSLAGDDVRLQAYRADPSEERIWLPFRDETSGAETYGAGRYLDLDADDRTDDGRWTIDFNRAYSPLCAYSEAYECPLVPMENWLEVRVEAGEKTYEP